MHAGLTLDKVRQLHCCVISPTRKLEGPVVDTSEASGPGFLLNARDGKQRVSVRAQQRDGVIRILAIAYDMDKDKEYRRPAQCDRVELRRLRGGTETRRTRHIVLEKR